MLLLGDGPRPPLRFFYKLCLRDLRDLWQPCHLLVVEYMTVVSFSDQNHGHSYRNLLVEIRVHEGSCTVFEFKDIPVAMRDFGRSSFEGSTS
jgi:hypothetical protein